jgi:hypothetical protein
MDESYIHGSQSVPFGWSDDFISGLLAPVSKGQRLVIVHASSDQSFILNAYIRFKSHQTTGDYPSDMNYTNFENWLTERLIPSRPPHSVLVIDNAPYYNVQIDPPPTSNAKKSTMISWLNEKESHIRKTCVSQICMN